MRAIWTRPLAESIDRLSISSFGIPSLKLMETAGASVGAAVLRHFSLRRPIVVLCGRGNNGGDGFAAAKELHSLGASVTAVAAFPDGETKDTAHERLAFTHVGGTVLPYRPGVLARWQNDEPIILDALLGLGTVGALKPGVIQDLLNEAAALPKKSVVAVDLPSGLEADDFMASQALLPADLTVTFGAPKPVHVLSPARALCGEIEVVDIGFAKEAIDQAWKTASLRLHLDPDIPELPALGLDAHKYTRGHVLVIGGSPGKTGAPLLAGLAALRGGAGWVTLALPETTTLPPELTSEPFFLGGRLDLGALDLFLTTRQVKALVLGPGTMTGFLSQEALTLLQKHMKERQLFVVFDAGALQGLGRLLAEVPLQCEHALLTPHPGEWRKLTDPPLQLSNPEAFSATLATLKSWGVSAIFKSATPLVLDPLSPQDVAAFTTTTNALAKAGSGDVLAGTIATLGARGMPAASAAAAGQKLLQILAKNFAGKYGADALTPHDLIEGLASRRGVNRR